MSNLKEIAAQSNAWPFQEAQKLVQRLRGKTPDKGYVLFETGYGPSGLPHIGTFGEVARTSMVRKAFEVLSDIPTKLFAFSDDMDGLRKVPTNVPNQEKLAEALGLPLTKVPDPFGTHESFGHHNNARLRAFLDEFGFEYEFVSATDCYRSGRFDPVLLQILKQHEQIKNVVLPTLGAERRATYSPFLPICPRTGRVLQVAIESTDPNAGTISYRDEDTKKLVEVPVTGGHCKLQWKADWGMRWVALDVDFEMYGKDLIPSAELSGKIAKSLGGRQPDGFNYELFLDENGEKISKSKGNGLTIEDWLRYATPESLSLYMFQKPRQAKRLYFDVIPRAVDEYGQFLEKFHEEDEIAKKLANPAWHIHRGQPPKLNLPISFGMLLNLASVCNAEDKSILWGFISNYVKGANPTSHPELDRLANYAVSYYQDFVKPNKSYRAPDETEKAALADLAAGLDAQPADASPEILQNLVFEIGKKHGFAELRLWFQALYQILLGQDQGPRMGSFFALYGVAPSSALIARVLSHGSLAEQNN